MFYLIRSLKNFCIFTFDNSFITEESTIQDIFLCIHYFKLFDKADLLILYSQRVTIFRSFYYERHCSFLKLNAHKLNCPDDNLDSMFILGEVF